MSNRACPERLLVTGGAGFIGSAFIRYVLSKVPFCKKIVNLDLLTYAAHPYNLSSVEKDERYLFVKGDICNETLVVELCKQHHVQAIVHFAAETHVDRSIEAPRAFFETNVGGTFSLLEVVRRLPHLHLHHVSTDEVYGSLDKEGYFSEKSPYDPRSPYAASKAASDHFVRSYAHTYGLSMTLSHCSNNYGPHQYPEKFIPLIILNCLKRHPLPVYGKGENVRHWLYVDDHAEAIWKILELGKTGETYDIGGESEKKNIDLLHELIEEVALQTQEDPALYRSLITFVSDRPGHDFRYAIDSSKIKQRIGWQPRHAFSLGIRKTVAWYLHHPEWFCVPQEF